HRCVRRCWRENDAYHSGVPYGLADRIYPVGRRIIQRTWSNCRYFLPAAPHDRESLTGYVHRGSGSALWYGRDRCTRWYLPNRASYRNRIYDRSTVSSWNSSALRIRGEGYAQSPCGPHRRYSRRRHHVIRIADYALAYAQNLDRHVLGKRLSASSHQS